VSALPVKRPDKEGKKARFALLALPSSSCPPLTKEGRKKEERARAKCEVSGEDKKRDTWCT
jgi:hypothetical protein